MDCPSKHRKVPRWKSIQQGVDPGGMETISGKRYVVTDGGAPCLLSNQVRRRGQRTRCFAEESCTRKTCKLLVPSSEFLPLVPTGMHLSGVGALRDVPLTCDYRNDIEHESFSLQNTLADPYHVTVLGPFRSILNNKLKVMCVATGNFIGAHRDVGNIAKSFSETTQVKQGKRRRPQTVNYAPTLDMLREWYKQLVRCRNHEDTSDLSEELAIINVVKPLIDTLARRITTLRELQRRCQRDPGLQKRARSIVRNLFYVGMYSRRWQGPNKPYPITWAGYVGTNRRPVSEDLIGRHVRIAGDTPRLVQPYRDGLHADALSEGRLYVMEARHLEAAKNVLCADAFLKSHMLACIESVYAIDGTYWPGEGTVADLIDLMCLGVTTDTSSCMRRNSAHIVLSALMLCSYVYKTRPAWTRFEGVLHLLDVHDG